MTLTTTLDSQGRMRGTRCGAAVLPNPRIDVPHNCGNRTKDPSGRCWRHR